MRKFLRTRMIRPTAWLLATLLVLPATAPAQAQQTERQMPPMSLEPEDPRPEGVPLTLEQALELAMESNLAIAVLRFEPQVSEALELGEQASFEPTLNLLSSYRDVTNPVADPFLQGSFLRKDNTRFHQITYTDPISIGGTLTAVMDASRFATNSAQFLLSPVFNSSVTLTYDQSLLRNLGTKINRTGIRVAKRNTDITNSQFRQVVIDTIQGVEQAYWDLKFAIEDLEVKRHSLRLSEETLAQNKIRVDVGTMAPIDVTTAEAEVASRRQDVLLAENTMENAQDTLLLTLNQPKGSPLWVLPIHPVDPLPFDAEMQVDLESSIEEAYRNRPDLEQTKWRLANDEDLVAQARNAMRWDLGLRAEYGKVGLSGRRPSAPNPFPPPTTLPPLDESMWDAVTENFDENFKNWQLALNLLIPLGNKAARSNYLTARLRQEQRRTVLAEQELNAVIAVRNAVRSVENTVERVNAAEVNVRLQRERLAAENKRYENGMTTTFDLFQFQDDLTRAESQVILALVDYNKSLAALEAAKGTLARDRGVQVGALVEKGRTEIEMP